MDDKYEWNEKQGVVSTSRMASTGLKGSTLMMAGETRLAAVGLAEHPSELRLAAASFGQLQGDGGQPAASQGWLQPGWEVVIAGQTWQQAARKAVEATVT